MRRLAHRVRQFFAALRPQVSDDARAEAYALLTPPQQQLFETMMSGDQQHGIAVMRRLRPASDDDRALLVAALLHDCGKGQVAVWQRVLHVLLGAVAPPLERRIASDAGAEWRRGMWRLLHHPSIGAEMAAAAGADADVVRMIREQDEHADDARLAALQAADEA